MILELKVKDLRDPWRTRFEVIYHQAPYVATWDVDPVGVDNPTAFFGDAKKALTMMAKHLADSQANLAAADEKDCEKAMRQFASGWGNSSYRNVSKMTANLVHGITTDINRDGHPVALSLEPFDIVIGKANRNGLKLKGLGDFKFDFMMANADAKDLTPGTKLCLSSLQDIAKQIEQWYLAHAKNPISLPTPSHNPYLPPSFQYPDDFTRAKPKPDPVGDYNKLLEIAKRGSAVILPNDSVPTISYGNFSGPNIGQNDTHIIYKTGNGLSIAPVKDINFRVMENRDLVTGRNLGQTVEITAGSFKTADGSVFEGELPVDRSVRSKNAKNPSYWAHAAEDRLNGIKQQVLQNLPEDDPTRTLICAISDLLSDHIHGMGAEPS